MNRMKIRSLLPLAVLTALVSACGGPSYVRGSDVPELDKAVMSTGLDKVDLQKLFKDNIQSLLNSAAMTRWKDAARDGKEATVAIFPVKNDTTEHVDDQLNALLADFETELVNSGSVTVISRERQIQLIEELKLQQSATFDQDKASQLGKQLGAGYFVTGKMSAADEKTDGERRVQYFLYMQVVDVETGAIRWQNKAELTKGLIK
jgi:uncharacterized protein (TIGR02722 family)